MAVITDTCSVENLSEIHGDKCRSYDSYRIIIKYFDIDFNGKESGYFEKLNFKEREREKNITMKRAGMVLHGSKGYVNLYIKNNLLTVVNRTRIETKSLIQLINLMRKHIDYTPEKPRTIKDILRDEAWPYILL